MEDGLRFAIREGGKTVGAGVVTKILNVNGVMRSGQRPRLLPAVDGSSVRRNGGRFEVAQQAKNHAFCLRPTE